MSSYTTEKIWASGYGRYMYASCSQTKGTSSENSSTINWTITTAGDSGTNYDTGATYLWIGGVERYYKARTSWSSNAFPAKAGSHSGSYTLAHNNDGTVAAQEVKLKTAIFTGEWNSTTVSGTWTLDKIDRFFSSTPSLSIKSRTETEIVLNWSTSENCSAISWSGGTSNPTVTGVGGTSGTVTFKNCSANTTYNIYGTFTRSDSSMTSTSNTVSPTTYQWPYVKSVSVSTLKIGNQQTVSIYNPLGRQIRLYMKQNNKQGSLLFSTSKWNPGSGDRVSYSFTPNADTLYSSIPSSTNGTAMIYCIDYQSDSTNGTDRNINNPTCKYEILQNDAEKPTFTASQISFADINPNVTNVTNQGTNGWLVQGLSNLKIMITSKATPNKGAKADTMSYSITFAGATKSATVGTTGAEFGTYGGEGTVSCSVTATDARGLSRTVTKNITYVAYRAPSVSFNASRVNNYGETVVLNAQYFGSDVNGTNGVKVQWSGAGQSGYFAGGSGANDYNPTENGSGETTLSELSNDKSYSFTISIIDKFGNSASTSASVAVGLPTMFVDVEQAGVGVNCLPQGKGLYSEDGIFSGYKGGKRLLQNFKMDLTGLSTSQFYPVLFEGTRDMITCEIASEGRNGDQPWNQNTIRFDIKSMGWSDTPGTLIIYHYGYFTASEITIGCIGRGTKAGRNCVWLRGGLWYTFYSNTPVELKETGWTSGNTEVYSVGSNYYGGSNSNVDIWFTPQSTISGDSAYIGGNLKVGGSFSTGSFSTSSISSPSGTLSLRSNTAVSGDLSASGLITAGTYIKAPKGATYDGTCSIVGGNSNEINFGGSNGSDTIYFGWRAVDSKPAPVAYVFGTGSGTAKVYGGTIYKQGLNVPAITISSSAPSAKQTGDIWVS